MRIWKDALKSEKRETERKREWESFPPAPHTNSNENCNGNRDEISLWWLLDNYLSY